MASIKTLLLPILLTLLAGPGWLGIRLADAERPTLAEVIPGSPAAQAGLRPGDVILSVAGKKTPTVEALHGVFQGLEAGQKVQLVVLRDKKGFNVEVLLGKRPSDTGPRRAAKRETPQRDAAPYLGLEVEEGDKGIQVVRVVEGGPVARAGLRKGDRVLRLQGVQLKTLEDIDTAMARIRRGAPVKLQVARGDKTLDLTAEAAARPGPRPAVEGRKPRTPSGPVRKPAQPAPARTSPKELAFGTDLTAARANAKKSNRPILLVFGATWCVNCATLKKALAHPSLQRSLASYERVWIDTDKQSKLADEFSVESLPHILVLAPDGKTQRKLIGYQPPDVLRPILRAGLAAGARKVEPKRPAQKTRTQPKRPAEPAKKAPPTPQAGAPKADAEVQRLRRELQQLRREQQAQRKLLEQILEELRKKQ